MFDLPLIEECSPNVSPAIMATLVQTESSANPYAIGVVGMNLANQPQSYEEALLTAKSLVKSGHNISMGLGQINFSNFDWLELTFESVFDPCSNLKAAQTVLQSCYERALENYTGDQALKASLSCYYSNNFERGFEPDDSNGNSYVDRFILSRAKIDYESQSEAGIYAIPDMSQNLISTIDYNNQAKEVRKDIKAIEDVQQYRGESWDVFSELSI